MTEPMNAEAVAQMVADREAGTPGPWVADDNEGYSPWGIWQGCTPTGNGKAGRLIARIVGDDAQAGFDAARVERLPDLEAAYLALAAENASLRASEAAAVARVRVLEWLLVRAQGNVSDDFKAWHSATRAALTPTTDKEPKTLATASRDGCG